jgi:hypothetical protein
LLKISKRIKSFPGRSKDISMGVRSLKKVSRDFTLQLYLPMETEWLSMAMVLWYQGSGLITIFTIDNNTSTWSSKSKPPSTWDLSANSTTIRPWIRST